MLTHGLITLHLLEKIQEMGVYRSGMNGLSWQMLEPIEKDKDGHHYDPHIWERIEQGSKQLISLNHRIQVNLNSHNSWAIETSKKNYISHHNP